MRTDDIIPALDTLSRDALLDRLREIRDDRKLTKAPPKKVRKKQQAKSKIEQLFAGMTPEEKAEFLKGMGS